MSPHPLDGFVVTGGGGTLGSVVPFGRKLTRADLDITHPRRVEQVFAELKPRGILHLAGMNIRDCERSPVEADRTNVLGTFHVAQAALRQACPLVFVSTGAVFDGPRGKAFDEADTPSPVNVYGRTKYLAEMLLQEMLHNVLIVRAGWLYGQPGVRHRNFVDRFIENARAGALLRASDDQTGSPTSISDFFAAVERLILEGTRGLVHVVNAGPATAFDMATEIVKALGSPSVVERMPATAFADGPHRSASETLASRRVTLRPWAEALREHVATCARA